MRFFKTGRVLQIFSFFRRFRIVWKGLTSHAKISLKWLVSTNSNTNFDYEISLMSQKYGLNQISRIFQVPFVEVLKFANELEEDLELQSFLIHQIDASPIFGILPSKVIWGRRIFWYVIVRILEPDIVVETGTDKGLGSAVIGRALSKNGKGKIISVDLRPPRGFVMPDDKFGLPIEFVTENSIEYLRKSTSKIDIFLHDSNHEYEYEYAELSEAYEFLSERGLLLSDNSNQTTALFDFALSHGMSFENLRNSPTQYPFEEISLGIARMESK